MNKKFIYITLVLSFTLFAANANAEPNWSSVPKKEITMFYPGVASWEFLISKDHSLGARNIKKGKKSCVRCHVSDSGEYDIMTNDIATGKYNMKKSQKPFEPDPLPDKIGFFSSKVQTAYDDEHLYIRVEWNSVGAGWLDKGLAEKGLGDRVALQINKDNKYFKKYGCMVSCHTYLETMPDSPAADEVRKHPYYAKKKRDKLRLYTIYSRTDGGGWADIKPESELKALIKEGGLIDLWEGEIEGESVHSEDGWILEDRDKDKNDITVSGGFKDGTYSVVFKRKLDTGDSRDVALKEGDEFSLAVAIHDNKAKKRQHYISFPFTIGIGTSGDIRASKVK